MNFSCLSSCPSKNEGSAPSLQLLKFDHWWINSDYNIFQEMLSKFHHVCKVQQTQRLGTILKQKISNVAPGVRIGDEVASALEANRPVVALESTIITHGLPYPQNLDVAFSVERVVRENGATPATIGIMDGKLIVGLSEREMISLVDRKDVIKTSRRDLSYVMSRGLDGGTTVSGTMVAAHMAGISVFVTGGIGGVHRGASETFDISADLLELSRTPVTVVCSGVKSILDIGLTLEYLETHGVPVITHAATRDFPAFFTPKSKFKAPYNLESTLQIAKLIHNQRVLNIDTGIVVGVPIPCDGSGEGEKIDLVIEKALKEANDKCVVGKDITPFVLGRIRELTGGASLESNIRLVENNAQVGAQLAVDLAKLKSSVGLQKEDTPRVRVVSGADKNEKKKRPVVIGGSIFDIKATVNKLSSIAEDTNIGKLHTSFGGVGRNITECLGRLGTNPFLISSVGKDHQGEMLLNNLDNLGIDVTGIHVSDTPTASYSIVANSSGELMMAVGDIDNHDEITQEMVLNFQDQIKDAAVVVLDGNLSESTLHAAMKMCGDFNVPTWFDPTTVSRAVRPFTQTLNKPLTYISPNYEELKAIHEYLLSEERRDSCNGFTDVTEVCMDCVDNLIITMGKQGIIIVSKKPQSHIFSPPHLCREVPHKRTILHYPSASKHDLPVAVRSVSGAGDSFASGVLFGYLQGYNTDMCIKGGLLAAYKSLHTYVAISDQIDPSLLSPENIQQWADFEAQVLSEDDLSRFLSSV